MLVIKDVFFISLLFIKAEKILLIVAHSRSLNAGCGLLESTRAIFNEVLFYRLSFLYIHAASKISHCLRHLGTASNSLEQITCRPESLLRSDIQVTF